MVILNPETIASQIETAKSMFADAKKANKQILVICEKEMFKQELEELGEKQGFHYMNHKIPA
jgi:ribosomal protein S2